MDYEQKYKSLITEIKERMTLISAEKEKASSQVDKLSLGGRVAILQELLAFTHELKESEDERIRKGLIKGLSAMRDIYKRTTFSDDAINIDDAIAWLEKQGEQKPTPKFKIGDTIHKIGENTVFPRTIEKIEDGDYVCNNSHSFVNIKFQDDYELVEQKPSWSEEDEKMLDSIIDCIDGLCFIDSDQLNWLKSLKPNHWKPSTEQLNALKQCIGGYYSEEADKKLESLYDDLKKLES